MTVQKRYYHLIGLFFDLGAPTVFLAISNFITIFKAHWRCIETHITVGCSRRLPVLGRVSTRAKLPHLNSFVFPQPAQGNVERSSFEFETPCSEKCTRVSVYYLGFDDFGGKLCSQSTAYQFLTLLVKCWFWVRSMWPPLVVLLNHLHLNIFPGCLGSVVLWHAGTEKRVTGNII